MLKNWNFLANFFLKCNYLLGLPAHQKSLRSGYFSIHMVQKTEKSGATKVGTFGQVPNHRIFCPLDILWLNMFTFRGKSKKNGDIALSSEKVKFKIWVNFAHHQVIESVFFPNFEYSNVYN